MVQNHTHSWLWWDAQKIDYNHLKNKPTSFWWQANELVKTHTIVEGTWDKSFTWFWFAPTSYKVEAWRDVSWWNFWLSKAIVDTAWAVDWYRVHNDWFWNPFQYSLSRVVDVRLQNASSTVTQATHVSFDADWMTLNFSTVLNDVKMIVTAYK